jgi:hypothetical protein
VSDQGGSGPQAGWYPDPEVPGGQRYWDGSRWGEQRPPASEPSQGWATGGDTGGTGGDTGGWAGSGGGTGDTGGSGGWQAPGSQPAWQNAPGAGQGSWSQPSAAADVDPWFWQSIVVTFLCCLPLGIVAIVKSSQAKSAKDVGNATLARQRAGEARTWTLVAAGVGLVANVLFFTLGVFGSMAPTMTL